MICADCKQEMLSETSHKVGEEPSYHSTTLHPEFHNLTAYICRECFTRIMGAWGVAAATSMKGGGEP